MKANRIQSLLRSTTLAAVAGLAVAAAPLALQPGHGALTLNRALADAGGNGHGHGRGHANDHSQGVGDGGGGGIADTTGDLGDGPGSDDVASANQIGSLNAAHASSTARLHAASNSKVGEIASYERDIQEGNLAAAAQDLGNAANKQIIDPVVHTVNTLLGIDDNQVDDTGVTVHDTESTVAALANGDTGSYDSDNPSH